MEILQIPAHPALLMSVAHDETITLPLLEKLLIRTINPCVFRNLQSRLDEECDDLDDDDLALHHRVSTIMSCFDAAIKMNVGRDGFTEFLRTPYAMLIGARSVRLYDSDDDGSSYPFVEYELPKDLHRLSDPLYMWSEEDAENLKEFMHARGWHVQGVASRDPLVFVR